MKKFKENKIARIADYTTMIMMLLWILGVFIGAFYRPFLFSMFLLPLAIIPVIISFSFSERDKYTSKFMVYIKDKISKSKTLNDFEQVYLEFTRLAIDGKTYCLSYPLDLKIIHRDIVSKIEILEMLAKNNGDKN